MRGCRNAGSGSAVKSRGFTLVEIAVVLLIMGFIAAMLFAGLRSASTSSKYKATIQALQNADAALVNYVTLTRRLPCPANGSLPIGNPLAGVAPATCAAAGDQTNGVVPWATLSIPQADVIDGFGSLITYRVAAGLTQPEAMNFTACDPAGGATAVGGGTTNGCLCPDPLMPAQVPPVPTVPTNCTPPIFALAGKGLAVQGIGGVAVNNPNAAPPALSTGAAYVLISHGPNLGPSWSGQGSVMNPGVGTIGTNEAINGANFDVMAPPATYFDSAIDLSETTSHFDDILLHPTISNVASRAGLGARSHPITP
jgi:prepilin-type N-terminal cleavage/methylation domain-containing protein